jgi:DNA-binding transcriptional MerR regulator
MTHLSVKTLRHYHEVGLLEPARVDAGSGYRYYSVDQLPAAQLIRRLRNLRMPVPEVHSVLLARDAGERTILIGAHLERLEAELTDTRAAVTSLRTLLDAARARSPITRRHTPAITVMSIADTVDPDQVGSWWAAALHDLRARARHEGIAATGPAGGVFDEALYQQEPAGAMVYLPIAEPARDHGRIRCQVLPAADLAVATHIGPPGDIDLAYADLGSYVAEHDIRVGPQIRELYLCDASDTPDEALWRTEIGWPILPG